MNKKNFLVELGTEELPPKALKKLATAFMTGLTQGLEQANLQFSNAQYYAAPRRLAVYIEALDLKQADREVEKRGPALSAAFKEDGCPTPAAMGFARSCGTEVDQLETLKTDKGAWLVFNQREIGKTTAEIIPDLVVQSLNRLPVPKRMRWASFEHEFVRPVHWLLMLHGDEILPCTMFGHKAGQTTMGHRFHHPDAITISRPADYRNLLETQGKVLVDYSQRKDTIRALVEEAAKDIGGVAIISEDLLDEVTGLVEWPSAVVGKFDESFLDVPSEAVISAMKNHQKYFHVVNSKEQLMPYFITVSNIESTNVESVRQGNERVIRPRLSDAEFFWQQDKKTSLKHYLGQLDKVVFQNKLGSLGDKTRRVQKLAEELAKVLQTNVGDASTAAELAKCDLMSGMVGEFPELQGIMGQYYALHDRHNPEVALAINEQYMPRFSGDELPSSTIGQILAIADKLDTTVGIFGIGQAPTGDKDPFALRRAILGVLRIIVEKQLPLNVKEIIQTTINNYDKGGLDKDTAGLVYQFMLDRSKGYFSERGIEFDVFDAVAAIRPDSLADMSNRIDAITAFKKVPEAESLAAANKRINNILKKASAEDIAASVDETTFTESAEKALFAELNQAINDTAESVRKKDYAGTLSRLAKLRGSVDTFFDTVMVMSENKRERANRLALLHQLSQQFLNIADVGRLQIK
ncbi:MAG: glycine--tRNA ligase subunit beta [Gammaproteobacteria bacterium]|nr:glycine--tRNA ligase subunit beta [Gammaproteobacteria bacterium]